MRKPIVSADSHITEPPGTYVDRIDKKYKSDAPRMQFMEGVGDVFMLSGIPHPIPMGLVAAAGKPSEQVRIDGSRFDELHRGGWDPDARMADQDRDGVAAEIIYPTVGMVLCNHPDFDYKKACMDAYNLWLADFCGAHPDRLFGCGQTAMRSPEDGIADLRRMKEQGLRGVMMPGRPQMEDYDSPIYDEFWAAAVELAMPISFHILTGADDGLMGKTRGPKLNGFLSIIRGCQDIMGMLIFGGVFERHPELKVVCVEADAGWVPHYMYRMDHAFDRHRYWLTGTDLSKKPSEYFREHIYVTFQDDWVAFQMKDLCNIERIMWANDFPHSDSTWPWSQQLLAEHTKHLTDDETNKVLHDNACGLYGIDVH